jgi:CRP-like cAMP-binding protein
MIAPEEYRPEAEGAEPSDAIIPLVTKLRRFVTLSESDVAALERLCRQQEILPANSVLCEDGGRPDTVCLMISGVGFRYKAFADGRRQILGYIVPGDFTDAYFSVSEPLDHNVALLRTSQIARIWIPAFLAVLDEHPNIERGISLAAMVDQAILREWLLNIGQRNAYEKLSHFFCEMGVRLTVAGLANDDGSIDLPFSQSVLADTIGLTLVHINRTLKRLRAEQLITLDKRRLVIPDLERLIAAAQFEREYLEGGHHRD